MSPLVAFLWQFIQRHWIKFATVFCAALMWSVDQTIWPYITKFFVNDLISYSGDESIYYHLRYPIILGLGLWIFFEIMIRTAGFVSARLIPAFETDIRLYMFKYVQGHSYKYFSDHLAGSVANKINDMARGATDFLGIMLWAIFPMIAGFIIAFSLLAQISMMFSLFLAVWFVGHILITIYWSSRIEGISKVHAEARSHLTGRIVDSLSNIINTKLFAASKYERTHLKQFQNEEKIKYFNQCKAIEMMRLYSGMYCLSVLCVGYNWLLLWSFQLGTISVGDAVMIFYLGGNVANMTWVASSQLPLLMKNWGLCKQALTVMQEPHGLTDMEGATELYVPKGEILYDKVSFSHDGSSPLFNNKNLTIQPGEKVGLVGVCWLWKEYLCKSDVTPL